MIEWWRSWHGAPTDPKWGVIARQAKAPRAVVVALAWTLMDAASQAKVRGDVSGADPEELAVALDVTAEQVTAILAAMRAPNPTTGKPRFIDAAGHITDWRRYQPKREDDRTRSDLRDGVGTVWEPCGNPVGTVWEPCGTVRDGCGNPVGTGGPENAPLFPPSFSPLHPPLDSPLNSPDSPPLPPPGAVDRIRKLVWSKSGLSEQAIMTKLVSTDTVGLRQVRGWFALGLAEERIVGTITRAFSEASEPIRRPWAYLDAALKAEAENPASAPDGSAGFVSLSVDWRKRLDDFSACGFWMDGWGPRPGDTGCEAPLDLLGKR